MALLNFNAATVDPQTEFKPIPNDWYNVVMEESDMKPTKDGQGAYLECRLSVLDGSYVNRKVFVRLNLQNNNEVAVEIAYAQLSAICHATGVIQCADSSELHGKPFMAKVVVRPPKGEFEASNEVKGFKAVGAVAANTSVAETGNTAASGATAKGGDPAWMNKKATTKEVKEIIEKEPVIEQKAADTTVEKEPEKKVETEVKTEGAAEKPPWMK